MSEEQLPKRNIDDRIDAMAQTMELLQAESLATGRKVDRLTATVAKHEADWERFRRIMNAAFTEYLRGEDDNDGEGE